MYVCMLRASNKLSYCYYFLRAVVDIPPGVQPSCSGHGVDTWRTFDGLQFVFKGQCTYLVFSDNQRFVKVSSVDCNRYSTCKKVARTPQFGCNQVSVSMFIQCSLLFPRKTDKMRETQLEPILFFSDGQ